MFIKVYLFLESWCKLLTVVIIFSQTLTNLIGWVSNLIKFYFELVVTNLKITIVLTILIVCRDPIVLKSF